MQFSYRYLKRSAAPKSFSKDGGGLLANFYADKTTDIRRRKSIESAKFYHIGGRAFTALLALVFSFFALLNVALAQSENVGIGTQTPDNSALLELSSTEKGLLIPRLTAAERNAIASPATGLLIYNTDDEEFEYNAGTPAAPNWVDLVAGVVPGDVFGSGAAGQVAYWTTSSTITGDANLFWDENNGVLGVGTGSPASTVTLDVNGDARIQGDLEVTGEIDPVSITLQPQGSPPTGVAGKLYYDGSQLQLYDGSSWGDIGGGGLWTQSGSDIYYNSGGVAIGRTSPRARLDIKDASGDGSIIIGNSSTFTDGEIKWDGLDFYGYNGSDWVSFTAGGGSSTLTGSGSAGQLAYWTSSSALSGNSNLFWDGANQVLGVGTSSPTSTVTLDVDGNARVQGDLEVTGEIDPVSLTLQPQGSPPTGVAGKLYYDGSELRFYDGSSWGDIGGGGLWTQSGSDIYYNSGGVGVGRSSPRARLDLQDASGDGSIIVGNTANSSAGEIKWNGADFFGYDGSDWVSLTSGGGSSTLTGSGSAGQLAFWSGASSLNGDDDLFWDSANDLFGVGTNTPTAKLEILSSDANSLRINPYNTAAGNTGELQFMELAANGSNYAGFKAPDELTSNLIWTLPPVDGSANDALITDGTGSLTWTPVVTGEVGGDPGAVQFNDGGSLGGIAARFYWDNPNKRLGIGTNSPDDALHVDGGAMREGWIMLRTTVDITGYNGSESDITWDGEVREDSYYYTHGGSSDEITIRRIAYYRISYCINVFNDDTEVNIIRVKVYEDGTEIPGSVSYANTSNQAEYSSMSNSFIVRIDANSTVDVRTEGKIPGGAWGDTDCDYDVITNSQITIELVDEYYEP